MGLVIALNKGRILKECLPILASCGVEPVEHPSESRKLIFDSRCGQHRLIVTRSADVLTYVEQGVADVGITGKDTILEYGAGMSFYERLDLKNRLVPHDDCRTRWVCSANWGASRRVEICQYCA